MARSKAIAKPSKVYKSPKADKRIFQAKHASTNNSTTSPNVTDILGVNEEVHLLRTTSFSTKFSSTLPFDPRQVTSWRTVAKALEDTKKGWSWFDAARQFDTEHDTRLGTFSYLPLEIRDKIYKVIIDDYIDTHWPETVKSTGGFEEQKAVPRPQLRYPYAWSWSECWQCEQAFALHTPLSKHLCWRSVNLPPAMRTSASGDEVDQMFLSQTVFLLADPKALGVFLGRMSLRQRSYLQRITLRLLVPGHDHRSVWKDWSRGLDECGSGLGGLKVVRFSIWGGNGIRPWDHRGPKAMGDVSWFVDILEIITIVLRRQAPKVKFVMDEGEVFEDEDSCLIRKVLREVEK